MLFLPYVNVIKCERVNFRTAACARSAIQIAVNPDVSVQFGQMLPYSNRARFNLKEIQPRASSSEATGYSLSWVRMRTR